MALLRNFQRMVLRTHAQTVAVTSSSRLMSAESTKTIAVRDAIRGALDEEMDRDPRVIIMGEEVARYQGAYKVTKGLWEKYGDSRVIDTPITESGFTGIGVGAGMAGLKPVVEFMTWNFSFQAIDHIINSAAKTRYMSGGDIGSDVVFRGPNGPPTGVGATHSLCFAQMLMNVPGLKVVSAWNAEDGKGLIKAAIRDPNPVCVLESELMYGESFPMTENLLDPEFVIPIGKAKIEKDGTDITIVTHGRAVGLALEAAKQLQENEGISAEVINCRTLRPLDVDSIVNSVCKTHRIMSVDEGHYQCGFGAEIGALMHEYCFDELDAPFERVTTADVPIPYSKNIEERAMVQVPNIVNTAKRVCYRQLG